MSVYSRCMALGLQGICLLVTLMIGLTLWGTHTRRAVYVISVENNWVVEDFNDGGHTATQRTVSTYSPPADADRCEVPVGGFRGWNTGVLTVLSPEVSVKCSKVMDKDRNEIERVSKAVSQWKNAITDEDMLEKVQNCSWLVDYFSDNLYNSQVEVNFPIAFSFVVHDSPQQILRLLRLLYRPQNSYCIHYDKKSLHKLFFSSIARCLENVIIPPEPVSVVWGHYSILDAQLKCLTALLEHSQQQQLYKWRYVINLCGKELPLVTNREIVRRLNHLNGASGIKFLHSKDLQRIQTPVKLNEAGTDVIHDKTNSLGPPPFPLSSYHKSSSYNILSFNFANYSIYDPVAIRINNFFKRCRNPEEHFYATLYKSPKVPQHINPKIRGGFLTEVEEAFWTKRKRNRFQYHCSGRVVHDICIISVRDLGNVLRGSDRKLFHNKYFMEDDPTVMDCMERRIVALNKQEYLKDCGGVGEKGGERTLTLS